MSSSLCLSQEATTIVSAEITFVFNHKDVTGSLLGFNSSSKIDQTTISNSSFEGSVAAKSIKTGNFMRDWSLKGSKYFNVDTYPKISFKSTSVTTSDNKITVKGKLTIKETTKEQTIYFTRNGKKLVGTTTLFASDYGINIYKKDRDKNKVTVKIILTLK